jgi:hypothetical protein
VSEPRARYRSRTCERCPQVRTVEVRGVTQAKVVWVKCEDFASLKRKFPSLLDPKEDEELLYDKEWVLVSGQETHVLRR